VHSPKLDFRFTQFSEIRKGFIADSSPYASVVALYIQVEAKKPASMNSWALRGTGRASGATGYLAEKGGGRLFVVWTKRKGVRRRRGV
jgi:hypothetical protein